MSAQYPHYVRTASQEGYMSHEGDVVRTLCGYCADIYLQGYMSAIYPSSVFSSGNIFYPTPGSEDKMKLIFLSNWRFITPPYNIQNSRISE